MQTGKLVHQQSQQLAANLPSSPVSTTASSRYRDSSTFRHRLPPSAAQTGDRLPVYAAFLPPGSPTTARIASARG
uniref:Uncharacterized protein n=1 Tax=Zea mays TaxID=4577 RepID=A0A804QZN8_MAIZE